MTLWTVAGIFMMAAIFWLNAAITATPYMNHVLGLEKQSTARKHSAISLLLLFVTILYFFIKVGSFSGKGVVGIADTTYIRFIWAGPVGLFVQLQVIVAAVWFAYSVINILFVKWLAYLLAVLLMGSSFLSIGHGSDAAWWGKLALLTHLLVAWLWFGSLNSLRKLAVSVPVAKAKNIMERFGVHMGFAVPALIIAGVVMYRSATGGWLPELPLSSYDTVLFIKLSLVVLILLVAAIHKLKFVPQLNNEQAAKRLKRSITAEMVLAISIFIVASALSSAFSAN